MYINKLKRYLVVLLCAIIVAGCSRGNSNDDPTVTPTTSTSQDRIILTWWNMFLTEEDVAPIIAEYERINPLVDIQYEQKGLLDGVDGYRADINAVLSDGRIETSPDIFTMHNSWAGKLANSTIKAPPGIVDTAYLDDFYPVVSADFNRSGIIALPMYMDSIAVIYNKDKLLEQTITIPSDDWSEFQIDAQRLTKRSGNVIESAGFSAAVASNTEFYFEVLNLLMLQNGAQLNTSSVTSLNLATDEGAVGAVSFYTSFIGQNNSTWNANMSPDIVAFLEGRLAQYVGPAWRLNQILQYNSTYNVGLNIGVVPMPQLSSTDSAVHWATYWGQAVSKDSQNADVAWDFIKFLTEPDQLRLLDSTVKQNGAEVGLVYPRKSMASEAAADPLLAPYVRSMPDAQNWDMIDGYEMQKIFKENFDGSVESLTSIQSNINSRIIERKNQFP